MISGYDEQRRFKEAALIEQREDLADALVGLDHRVEDRLAVRAVIVAHAVR